MSTANLPALLRDPTRRAEAVAAVGDALAALGRGAPARWVPDPERVRRLRRGLIAGTDFDSLAEDLRLLSEDEAAELLAGEPDRWDRAAITAVVGRLAPSAIPVGALARLWLTTHTGLSTGDVAALLGPAPRRTLYRGLLPLLTDDLAGLLAAELLADVLDGTRPAHPTPEPADLPDQPRDSTGHWTPVDEDPGDHDHAPQQGSGGRPPANGGYGQAFPPADRVDPCAPSGGRGAGAERVAWPVVAAPEVVPTDTEFDLVVGIGAEPSAEVTGTGSLRVPAGDVLIEVTVMFDPVAFAPVGWANPVTLAATGTNPFPRISLRVRALAGVDLGVRREIGAAYFVGGALRGYGSRTVQVTDGPGERLDLVDGDSLDLGPLLAADAPDLVVVVERGADVCGQTLLWSARSPLAGVVGAPGPHRVGIGDDPAGLARAVRLKMGSVADPRDAVLTLVGLGREIGDKVPVPVADAIRAVVAARAPAPPSVLLLSAEPHVPWELAVLGEPEPDRSPFLGAQVVLGRWVLDTRRPRPTPPVRASGAGRAVVTARYEGVPGWSRLPSAEAEAAGLAAAYPPCAEVAPLHSAVLDFLESGPPARAVHFALHGKFDPDNAQDGLVLLAPAPADPNRLVPRFLSPEHVSAMSFTGHPFVFLNACQVGAGGTVLGDYSGLARAFLAAGACGVVAPLWNVDDVAASELAEAFYAAAYRGLPAAEVLRGLRAGVDRRTRDGKPATTMAYQFFGHPRLALHL
ncbi:CHAT domain-containing protein [Actinokineospora spheciospongiae]|uniref:CHAT domain-containing protein n=1 Tax=Actinokineospora spheciospongiae TaxID=909613 RepID=UPI000D70E251|nr:CHAT domain-containing protein [Actinokineospora spheciospongiae]PWW51479.1 CHAT domain-containing protein [Actinokineospora spheciospongiae]